MARGFFGDMFDLNRDGELDAFERALDMMAFDEMMEEEEESEEDLWDDDEADEEW